MLVLLFIFYFTAIIDFSFLKLPLLYFYSPGRAKHAYIIVAMDSFIVAESVTCAIIP